MDDAGSFRGAAERKAGRFRWRPGPEVSDTGSDWQLAVWPPVEGGMRRFWAGILRFAASVPPRMRWEAAVLCYLSALVARLSLGHTLGSMPFTTFVPAVIVATLLSGWGPAALVVLLSMGAGALLLPPPFWQGAWGIARGIMAVLLFGAVAGFQVMIVAALIDAVRTNVRLAQHEKTLFLELQHRVANSQQFIATMLSRSRKHLRSPEEAAEVLEQAAQRVAAFSRLHRRMYEAAGDDRGLAALLHEILLELFQDVPVAVRVEMKVAVPLTQMTPLVLLVTEAATNSLKHAFRNGTGGDFAAVLEPVGGGGARLTVRDSGPGLPEGRVPAGGLGMRIMYALADQLGGVLSLENCGGTVLRLEFPLS